MVASSCSRVVSLFVSLVVLSLAASTGVGEVARMALPGDLETRAQRLEISGFGGRNRGSYRLEDLQGEFTRIESRWAVLDPLYARNRAKSSFTLSGSDLASIVSAECEMTAATVTLRAVTFDPRKMTYQCSFARDGMPIDAQLVLGEVKPDSFRARLATRSERAGEAVIEGLRVGLASVHRYATSRLGSQVPVGYVLDIDGAQIAAIELTDSNPTLYLDLGLEGARRDVVLMAALALAVLRDPADSTLGD